MEELQKVGLSPNEAKCYIALLNLGSASANEISRKSGIHRVAVYDAIRGLREKGLVSQIVKANKMLFEAASPEKIEEIIKEKEEQLENTRKQIPLLQKYFLSSKEKQEVHSFKGLAGIKTILQDMLRSKTDILDFGAEFKVKEFLGSYYTSWERERLKNKIKMRIVANVKIKPVKMKLAEIKYVPEKLASSASTYIYGNKVALIMWVENPVGIMIEHSAVAESYRNYFEYLWSVSKV